MSQSPHPSESHREKAIWSVFSSRPFFGALLVAGVLSGAAIWRGLIFIERDLAPMIETNLQKLFNRPIVLGPLESFSLTSLKFGPSSVPPHQTTLNGRSFFDKDQATADSVIVKFNPLTVLLSQTLNLDIILNRPKAYIDQAPDNRWIATKLTPAAEGWLKFKVKTIRAVEGTVELAPTKAPQRVLQQANGVATFEQDGKRIKIAANTSIDSGGRVALKGQYETPKQSLSLTAQAQKLVVPPLLGLLPSVPVVVRSGQYDGTVKLGYQPQQPLQLTSQGTFKNASIGLPTQSIDLNAQQVQTDVVVTLPPNQIPVVKGNAAFTGAQVQVPEALFLANGKPDRQTVRNASGTAVFLGASRKVQLDVKAALGIGGQVKARGEIKLPLDQAKLLIQAQNVPATLFDGAYKLPVRVKAGRVGGNFTVQIQKNQRPFLQGVATLQNVDAAVTGIPQPFLNTSGYVRLNGLTATLDEVKTRYGSVPAVASGSIDPDRGYSLTAQTEAVEINQALKTLQIKNTPVPVAGQVQVVNLRVVGAIKQPILTGQVRNVGQITLDRVPMSNVSASFKVVPSLVTVSDILANPVSGGAVTGQAVVNLVANRPAQSTLNANFQANGLSGDAIAQLYQASPAFVVGLVSGTAVVSGPLTAVETNVAFKAPEGTYPARGEILIQQGNIRLKNAVAQVKGGVVEASGLVNAKGVELTANLSKLALGAFSPQLRGALSGRVTVTGPRTGFSAQTARAEGTFQFSEGLSLIQDRLTTQVRWDGNQVLVERASAPNFVAKGSVGVQLQGAQGPQVTALNLDITANQYEINRLAVPGLAQNPAHGLADIQGRLSGTPSAPVLTSRLSVNDFRVSQLDFERQLAGSLDFSASQGLRLNLDGTRDRIQVALDPAYRPISLEIRRDQATVIGLRTGPDLFNLAISDVPLLALNDYVRQDYGQISGLASGNFSVNLKTYDGSGTFAVAQPGLGRFVGDRLSGQVSYLNGVATLSQSLLVQGENQYQLDATASNLRTNPQVSGRLLIAQARLEDLIAVGKAFPFPGRTVSAVNLGSAASVEAAPISLENIPIWQQLQRLAEIEQFLAQRQADQKGNGIIPNLDKLAGRLQGEIRFAGSQKAGFSGAFDLQGQDWTLDPYKINQFVAKGTLDPAGISLEPLSLVSGDSQAYFSGRIGRDRQGGQLVVNNVPVAPIADLLNLPVNVSGQLNATANLAGTLDNPAIQGTVSLDQGILNSAPIQQANGQFDYENARLTFNGLASINSPEPIRVSGNIPYALPFSTVKPSSDTIALNLSVKDQGLALVNLFTDQVGWVDGKGDLSLEATGTLTKPLLKGSLVVQDATIRTQALTDPLTQVNGDVLFDRDRIMVQSLTGRYNQGVVTAQGTLPIFDNALVVSDPLTAVLNDTNLNLKGLYQGEASGNVTVMGSAFQPKLGGVVSLQNGQVLLSRAVNSSGDKSTAANAQPGGIAPLEFEDLQVQIGKNLRISQPPVLSFIASGNIGLNGSLDAPRPTGLVRFAKGSINLFTTTFQVDPKRENFAQFTPTYGLDPYLKLSLRTTASEVVTGRATNLDEFADIQPGALGSVQSIRIRAHVQGRASQLATRFKDVLELTSTPSRTQTEILALLSGGVSQAIQSGDAQGAVVNLASSAALNQVQGFLNGFLGSRVNFRLFPLLTPSTLKKSNSSVLQLGAEVGYDITDRLSVSAIQVVTDPTQPTQLNASYNLTNKLQFRGSVDLSGGAVGILEYRIRF